MVRSSSPSEMVIPEIVENHVHPLANWVDVHRAERQSFRLKSDPAAGRERSRAIVTMVHNEAVFLPIWLRYYSRFFRPEDIYVLDHESTDGSTEVGGFRRQPVSRERVDHVWMLRMIEAKQHELFEQGYDMVLVTDVDEIVIPDPELGDLGSYMDTMVEDFVSCMGYEIVHLPDRESELDPDQPIMEQRRYWAENATYNKSALATEPSRWVPGFHRREDHHFHPDPDLFMVHLHRVDYESCRVRHRQRSFQQWGSEDLDSGWAAHNRLVEGEKFDRWFFHDSGFEGFPLRIERIPERWRGTF